MEDWDIISTKDVIGSEQHLVERTKTLASAALPFTQSILSQVPATVDLTHALAPTGWATSLAHVRALPVFRSVEPCPGSSRPSAGLMRRR